MGERVRNVGSQTAPRTTSRWLEARRRVQVVTGRLRARDFLSGFVCIVRLRPLVGCALILLTLVAIRRPAPALDLTCGNSIPSAFVGCRGDCDLNGDVGVDELVRLVGVALGSMQLDSCAGLLTEPSIVDVVQGVSSAIAECPVVRQFTLVPPSSIKLQSPEGDAIVEEPLDGGLTVVDDGRELQFVTVARVTRIHLESKSFSFEAQFIGQGGCLKLAWNPPRPGGIIFLDAPLREEGDRFTVGGFHDLDTCCGIPDALSQFEASGTSQKGLFRLNLWATAEPPAITRGTR